MIKKQQRRKKQSDSMKRHWAERRTTEEQVTQVSPRISLGKVEEPDSKLYDARQGEIMYVAVVLGFDTEVTISNRVPHGDWSCFVNKDKGTVIRKALSAIGEWNKEKHRNTPYRILVGSLTEEVNTLSEFVLLSL